VRRVTRTPWYEGFPSWSPDRSRIVYVAAPKGDSDIYVMNADGTGVRRLAGSAKGATDLYPAWSPDGRLIAFTSNRGGIENELYVMRADGTKLRRLTRTPKWVDDSAPSFSPDGRHIVFASNRVSFFNYELYRIRVADGGGLTRLTFWGSGKDGAPGDDLLPDYSPDGKRIAFVSDRNGGYAIWVMNANGKGLREVVRHRGRNVVFPRFSPDGRSLVYTTFDPAARAPRFELWTVGIDGSNRTAVGRGSEADW
jgi:Tol biopolymer transport system component